MKKSKLQRKFVNAMRGMADVPWPARRFKYPPTSGPLLLDRRCMNIVGVSRRRRSGWRGLVDLVRLRRPVHVPVACGAPLMLVPFNGRRRGHLDCVRCGPLTKRIRRQRRRQ